MGKNIHMVDHLHSIIMDHLRYMKTMECICQIAPHLPIEIVDKIAEIGDFPPDEVESGWEVPGFVAWYEKTHSVKGVS